MAIDEPLRDLRGWETQYSDDDSELPGMWATADYLGGNPCTCGEHNVDPRCKDHGTEENAR